jgi:hypothetical protein
MKGNQNLHFVKIENDYNKNISLFKNINGIKIKNDQISKASIFSFKMQEIISELISNSEITVSQFLPHLFIKNNSKIYLNTFIIDILGFLLVDISDLNKYIN